MPNWINIIQKIKDGESVNEDVANRSINALIERTDYLKSMLGQAGSGYLSSQGDANPLVAVGDAVYYSSSTSRFEKAIVAYQPSPSSGRYIPAETCSLAGIVISKPSSSEAVIICLARSVDLADIMGESDLGLMMESGKEFEPGFYFLSYREPGKVTKSPDGALMVPVGYLNEGGGCSIGPVTSKGHNHFRYAVGEEPAASQGSGSSGWFTAGSGHAYANYYFRSAGGNSTVVMAAKVNPLKDPVSSAGANSRIDIYESGGVFHVEQRDDVDDADPEDTGTLVDSYTIPIPEYGEWIDIVGGTSVDTYLSVAFFRSDSTYADTLEDDILTGLPSAESDGKWSFLIGVDDSEAKWTNANPFDDESPSGAKLRYMIELDDPLYQSFPPRITESCVLYRAGLLMGESVFSANPFGIFWMDSSSVRPWDNSYDYSGSNDPVDIALFMQAPAGFGGTGLVESIASLTPAIRIISAKTKLPASTGCLALDFDLNFSLSEADPTESRSCVGGVSPDGKLLLLSKNVSSLVAGPGVTVEPLGSDGLPTGGENTGRVRIGISSGFSGNFTGMSLKNAKESRKNGIPYIEFPQPSTGDYTVYATFRVPIFDPGEYSVDAAFYGLFLGEAAAASEKLGVFKVSCRVANSGTSVGSSLAAASRVEAWRVKFPASYSAFDILSNELPTYGSGPTLTEKFPRDDQFTLKGLSPGDIVSLEITRDANSSPFSAGDSGDLDPNDFAADNYASSIGLVGLRWAITLQ